MTDDAEIVRLSDRVMARRHSLTDRARREEIGGEDEWGSLAALSFNQGRYGRWGQPEKNTSRSALVPAVYLEDDQEAPILVDNVFQRDWRLNCAPAGSAELLSTQ